MSRPATGRSEADAITIDDDDDDCQFAGYGSNPPQRPFSGRKTASAASHLSTSRETLNSNKRKAKRDPDLVETGANFTMKRGHAHRFDEVLRSWVYLATMIDTFTDTAC